MILGNQQPKEFAFKNIFNPILKKIEKIIKIPVLKLPSFKLPSLKFNFKPSLLFKKSSVPDFYFYFISGFRLLRLSKRRKGEIKTLSGDLKANSRKNKFRRKLE